MKTFLWATAVFFCCVNFLSAQSQRLVVHEWGTFTSLQDETGRAVGGINSDDEPVPYFVHRLRYDLIIGTPSQGAPRCYPDVTMRLETPVIYFHPPKGSPPISLDVMATFKGGWLTEYYPYAAVDAPGFVKSGEPGTLTSQTNGTVKWSNVQVGPDGMLEQNLATHVWTTPRNVDAATVTTGNPDTHRSESEKYLFYRGVGHLDAPLRIRTNKDNLRIESQLTPDSHIGVMLIKHLWQYQMRADGKCAFRVIKPMQLFADAPAYEIPATFTDSDYSTENLTTLRKAMHEALVADGLFSDEATALLGTWELSYFKSSGMRILFLVPQPWTDRYLPLKLSVPADITRTMVGRIELVSPIERAGLRQIVQSEDVKEQDQAYEKLGRFRNGLVLDEQAKNPSPAMAQFIARRRLQGFGQ